MLLVVSLIRVFVNNYGKKVSSQIGSEYHIFSSYITCRKANLTYLSVKSVVGSKIKFKVLIICASAIFMLTKPFNRMKIFLFNVLGIERRVS